MNKMCKKTIVLLFAFILALSLISCEKEIPDYAATNELITNGNGGKTDVGTWYMTYNNSTMWSNNFGSGNPIEYKALISRNPDKYGIPNSGDVDEIDMHLEMLAEAKIDFVVFDITNGGLTSALIYGTGNEWIVDNAKLTCERIALWNEKNEWQIKYALAIGTYGAIREGKPYGYVAEVQAEAVYKDFYENEVYGGDHYYQVDGKPLLILFDWDTNAAEEWNYYAGDRTYGDRFTIRAAQCGELGTYGWQTNYGTVIHDEVELVSPGFANNHGAFIAREDGAYYRRNWEKLLSNKLPRIVMVMAFNDFNEHLAVMPADSSGCNDVWEEKWEDENGNIDNYMYWNMTVNGIRQIRIMNGEMQGEFTGLVVDNTDDADALQLDIDLLVCLFAIGLTTGMLCAAVICVIAVVKRIARTKQNEIP